MRRISSSRVDHKRAKRILCGAIAAGFASGAGAGTAHAIVQDFNRARGADGYNLTNAAGDQSGTYDGQEFQPAPSAPGLQGEFWFAGAGLGQPFDLDVHAPLGQGVTNTANDHGGYMYVDYKGPSGGPFYWYGGTGNTTGPFPGIVLTGNGNQPLVPALSQVLAYADVLAPAGKPFRYYINSPYDGQDHQFSFTGVGTGAWQTVGGTLAAATPVNGGVVYSNAPFDTPNGMAMTVQFSQEIAAWDNGSTATLGPAILRIDNLTFTPASVTWGGTTGGNWSTDSNWKPLLTGGIPMAPSGRNATAIFGTSASPQVVALDAPVVAPWTLTGGGDYPTANNFYAGTVVFDSVQGYTLAGPEPLHIDTTAANGTNLAGPAGLIQVLSGSHTISAPVILARSTTLDVAGSTNTLTIGGNLSVFASDGNPVSLGKLGGGTAVVNNIRVTGSVDVSGGTLKIAPNSTAAGVSFIPGTITISSSKLDLTDNKIVTKNPAGTWNGSAYTDVTGLVAAGRNGNTLPLWDGTGIVTSQTTATGGNYHSIGVARASDVRPATATATGLWAGQTITGTDTLVMYTYGGDATLDGKINIDDYVKIDSGIAAGLTGWSNGDFNYDGKVSIDDYITVIDANIGNQTGVFFTGAGAGGSGVVAVPEPAAISLLGLGAVSVLRRRRQTM